jgi:hypothetical protein
VKFQPGEHVICINGNFRWAKRRYARFPIVYPKQGQLYVVRDYVCHGNAPAIVLEEMMNPIVQYNDGVYREAGFWDERFAKAPSIEGIKQIAEEVSRWLPAPVKRRKRQKEDA